MQKFYSNGKLLLTGEYLVLDGAKALAMPTVFGQTLSVEAIDEKKIIWEAITHDDRSWMKTVIQNSEASLLEVHQSNPYSKRLIQILNATQELNPEFLKSNEGFKVTTKLDFPLDWGLGSSSTLINNIAQWAKVDAFDLLNLTFGGSGYDIACAQHDHAISYSLNHGERAIKKVDFNPKFKAHLYFVHMNIKQNSRAAIYEYQQRHHNLEDAINQIDALTENFLSCKTLNEFMALIETHEAIMSACLKKSTIKNLFFNDFEGALKSLGAWGGDFILVASAEDPRPYFTQKGFQTVVEFDRMILK